MPDRVKDQSACMGKLIDFWLCFRLKLQLESISKTICEFFQHRKSWIPVSVFQFADISLINAGSFR